MRIALGAGTDLHAPMGATEPVVALDHVEPGQATGARSFQVLHGPHNGSTRATMFVGYIPPGKAPWHYHLYDEIVWILRGEGRLHIGDDTEPLAPGVAFRLRPREVHIVENTQPDAELAVLGIFTPAGSPSAAYLEPHVAGTYVVRWLHHDVRPAASSFSSTSPASRHGVYEDVLLERGASILRVELDEGESLPGLDGDRRDRRDGRPDERERRAAAPLARRREAA